MKQISSLLFLFITLGTYSQIELEHTYPDGLIKRTLLENSGEKYYYTHKNVLNSQFFIFNADHSLWKTIDLPLPEDADTNSVSVSSISETKINADDDVEICYSYKRIIDGIEVNEGRIVNENSSILLTVEGANDIRLASLVGYPDKIITSNDVLDQDRIYSLPEPNLEHEYSGSVKRINFENAGEKYYFLNHEELTIELYNSDHTPWKTIELIVQGAAGEVNSIHISEIKINIDDLIEVIYVSSHIITGSTITYIINENSEVLLSIDSAWDYALSEEEGLGHKLIVKRNQPSSEVYALPGLNLEHSYNGNGTAGRIKFENSCEKYYYSAPYSSYIQLFYADHTPWMIIDLDEGIGFWNVEHISDSKIDPNEQIEIIYYSNNWLNPFSEVYIINQDGEVLLAVPDVENLFLSEIPGQQNKIIFHFGDTPENYWTKVYSLPTWSLNSSEIRVKEDLTIYPNPSSEYITLDTGEKLPESISIYSIQGKLISEIKNLSSNVIDVSFLSSGFYLLVGKEGNQMVFSEKIIVE